MSAPLKRRICAVTGGTRGIGLGIARALARDGWTLALCGLRSREEVADVVSELASLGGGAEYWPADIGSPNDRAQLLSSIVAHFGTLHALVNNAGRAPRVRADLLAATEDSFEEVLRTNLQGPYFLTQAVARLFVEQQADARRSARHRVRHFGVGRDGVAASRRVLREQGGPLDGGEIVCRSPRARSHSGLRGAPGHHRHGHDGRRQRDVRQAHRRRPRARRTMGTCRTTWGARSRRCSAATWPTRQAQSSTSMADCRFRGYEVMTKRSRSEVVAEVEKLGVVAIIRMPDPTALRAVVDALAEGGVRALEVTMTVPRAIELIAEIAPTLPEDFLFGAGTLLDADTVHRAVDAGAQFIVSPVFKPEVVEAAHEDGVPVMPGCFTPTEILAAWEMGADIVKVFPRHVCRPGLPEGHQGAAAAGQADADRRRVDRQRRRLAARRRRGRGCRDPRWSTRKRLRRSSST